MSRMRCSRRSGVILYIAMRTTTTWSTPHHRLRRSLSSRRSLLVDALANWHQSLRSVSALNFHLRGSRQRSWMPGLAKPDQGGNIQGNGWRLRRSGHAKFSRPRVWPVIPFNFYPKLTFTSHAAFFDSFLGSKKESFPSFFRPPRLPRYYIVRASRPSAVGFRQYPLRYTVLITSLPSLARRRCTCTSTVRVS